LDNGAFVDNARKPKLEYKFDGEHYVIYYINKNNNIDKQTDEVIISNMNSVVNSSLNQLFTLEEILVLQKLINSHMLERLLLILKSLQPSFSDSFK
jgi:hypothetical protein